MRARAKEPETPDNYVGLELEFVGERTDHTILQAALAIQGLDRFVRVDWENIDNEATYLNGFEAKLLLKETDYQEAIARIIPVLQAYGSVNESCGMHVHLDMRNRDKQAAYNALCAAQDRLFAMCAAYREFGPYCRRVTPDRYTTSSRYHAIHVCNTYPTLEVRMHESTFDISAITTWIDTLVSVVNEPV